MANNNFVLMYDADLENSSNDTNTIYFSSHLFFLLLHEDSHSGDRSRGSLLNERP